MNFLRIRVNYSPKCLWSLNSSCPNFCTKKEIGQPNDILMKNLTNVTSVDSLLQEIKMHYKVMNDMHALQAMTSLFELQKNNSRSADIEDFKNSVEFNMLASIVTKNLQKLDVNELVTLLKVSVYFKLSSNSVLVQSILQLLKQNINQLSIKSIIFMTFLIEKLKANALIDALKIALPILFEIKLQKEIDVGNVDKLTDTFIYASKNQISKSSLDLIAKHIVQSDHQISVKNAFSLYWSLTDLSYNNSFDELMPIICDILIDRFRELPFDDVCVLLRKMHKMCMKRRFDLYNENLCTHLVNYFVDHFENNEHLSSLTEVVAKVGSMNFEHERLAKFVLNYCNRNPEFFNQISIYDIVSILHFITFEDNVQEADLHEFLSTVTECFVSFNEVNKLPWIKICMCLAKCKYFDRRILERTFCPIYFEQITKNNENNTTYLAKLSMVKRMVLTYSPENQDVLPLDEYFDRLTDKSYLRHGSNNFKEVLELALGGDSYVYTNLRTRLGFYTDHAVVMRKGGYPVSHENQNENNGFIEDINIPNASKIVAVCLYPSSCYLINNKMKLKIHFQIFLNLLEESSNVVTLPISLDLWDKMQNQEKIPFLMQSIKLKIDENDNLASSSAVQN